VLRPRRADALNIRLMLSIAFQPIMAALILVD
jgi:hypothetical protein